MRQPRAWEVILFILGMLFLVLLMNSAAYFICIYFFRMQHWYSSGYLFQIITTIFGIILFGITVYIISNSTRKRHLALWEAIIDALRKIARGDFNIQLNFQRRDHQFLSLVENINHMARQLQQMEEMRQEFISNVSHEIQSPLTSIRGFARALQHEGIDKEESRHYLEVIESESNRLSKISDNLLKLTSLESHNHPFERKHYRLDKQIRNIVLTCEPHWVEKNLEMEVSLEEAFVFADEDLLSQVWINLIHNSIKFTPPDGQIHICLQKGPTEVSVSISDSGIGISHEEQMHIFERFYKADKSRTRTIGGSGLGLSIVKKIVEMHEGEISVHSQVGKGTSFTVSLPNWKDKK
ncbi:HAMP domain-containing sensor histidine kinase [Bacillus sp. FJAT-49736]|uniref:sensor histidine kinase n=1 Tax=Bacillus sp. FJAT-49736 TaxID=2833582 RepID=UPI001BC9DC01|nr:HAMP domain-containing sensor histidine kinase [Bacillus sp. FJAT-49736]MBS4175316.1 two-component sensor histidine kinase [Bacillus sp. FJAT-49736]